ncbi:hypothetical protein C8R46DRAFT_1270567 [Mycena filopes]|nr:hypothetical protein C8R46DRAFT_1270567 [Mycena filopes]
MSSEFPAEVWLRIFSYVVDGATLRSVVLACSHLHNLGMEELLRTLVWDTQQKAESNLEFWDGAMHLQHIPRTLRMNMNVKYRGSEETPPRILSSALRFPNLTSLSLYRVCLGPAFYQVLAGLPNLTHLSLSHSQLASAPPHFPHSFPSLAAEDSQPVAVTNLTMEAVDSYFHRYDRDDTIWTTRAESPEVQLFLFLPRLHTVTLKSFVRIPRAVLAQLTTFALAPGLRTKDAIDLLNVYLPHTPALLHLRIGATVEWARPGAHADTAVPLPTLTAGLPLLHSFVGPGVIAADLIARAPVLASLTVNDFLPDTAQALTVIERASADSLQHIDLSLVQWDDEVVLAITRRLLACREVRVVYRFSQPSNVRSIVLPSLPRTSYQVYLTQEFTFALGIDHLERLPDLHTLHLHSVPPPPPPAPTRSRYRGRLQYFSVDDSDSDSSDSDTEGEGNSDKAHRTMIAAVPPEDVDCGENLAAWTRYNAALRTVRFVEGREWVRRELDVGGRRRARWGVV